jgi:hypothetical protein
VIVGNLAVANKPRKQRKSVNDGEAPADGSSGDGVSQRNDRLGHEWIRPPEKAAHCESSFERLA